MSSLTSYMQHPFLVLPQTILTILLSPPHPLTFQGSDNQHESSDQAKSEAENQGDVFGTTMESEEHESSLLVGLAWLRDQGLLLDTCLWAEGEKYQVRRNTARLGYYI